MSRRVPVGAPPSPSFEVAGDAHCAFWDLVASGSFEPGVRATIERHCAPGATFVDIGAWIGCYTLLAAALGARVIAFEPDPVALAELQANAAANEHLAPAIEVRPTAVARRSGRAALTGGEHGLGSSLSRLSRGGGNRIGGSRGGGLPRGRSSSSGGGGGGRLRGRSSSSGVGVGGGVGGGGSSSSVSRCGGGSGGGAVTIETLDARALAAEPAVRSAALVKIDIEGAEYAVVPRFVSGLGDAAPALLVSLHGFTLRRWAEGRGRPLRLVAARSIGAARKSRLLWALRRYRLALVADDADTAPHPLRPVALPGFCLRLAEADLLAVPR